MFISLIIILKYFDLGNRNQNKKGHIRYYLCNHSL